MADEHQESPPRIRVFFMNLEVLGELDYPLAHESYLHFSSSGVFVAGAKFRNNPVGILFRHSHVNKLLVLFITQSWLQRPGTRVQTLVQFP